MDSELKKKQEIQKIVHKINHNLNCYKSNINNTLQNSFEEHQNKLMNLYGIEYLKIFIENAENIIEFFIKGKNRKQRKYEEIKGIDISNDNDISESTTEINNGEEFEKFFLKRI